MDGYVFSLEMQVRDYELDAEGIVNNANYLHYLEHTRHQFCAKNGISFAEMQERGIASLGNELIYDLFFLDSGAICALGETSAQIFRTDGTPVVKAVVSCVCLSDGKLDRGDMLAEIFKDFLK